MTDATQPSFGPTALATPANAITIARLLATPLFVALIVVNRDSWVTAAVGAAVGFSDGFDGWIARKQGTTRSGAFLDPLADKVVVVGALFALGAAHILPWLAIALITFREFGLVAYRSYVARRGISIPARVSAKIKTLVQDFAIGFCVLPPVAHNHSLQLVTIWLAVALTLFTGAQYLWDGRRLGASEGS